MIIVGDAAMAPEELYSTTGNYRGPNGGLSGMDWLLFLISVLQGAFPALPLGFGILSLLNSMEETRLQAWEAQGIPVGFLHRIPQAYRAEEIAGYVYPSLAGAAPVYSPASLPVVAIGGRWEARVAGPSGDLRRRCDAFVAQALSQLTLPANLHDIFFFFGQFHHILTVNHHPSVQDHTGLILWYDGKIGNTGDCVLAKRFTHQRSTTILILFNPLHG